MRENNFASKFATMRKNSGITQQELGNMLGVSNRAVSKWETGLALPSTENVYKLSRIFGVPVDHFFDASTSVKPAPTTEPASSGMKSLEGIYRIGFGPSSSHTIGPERACEMFKAGNPTADNFKVTLYGSLAKTGVGHGTDRVIKKTLAPSPCEISFNYTEDDLPHPNTFDIYAYSGDVFLSQSRVASVGGGKIVIDGIEYGEGEDVYPENSFEKIAQYCERENIRLWQYAERIEGKKITEYLSRVWHEMKRSIADGLADDGILPGGLDVQKRAKQLYNKQHIDESAETRENRMVCSYAFAVSEQNACAERIVTAPTCGAAGVLPAVLYYQQQKRGYSDTEIVHALAAGGIVGNLIKTNASISGSECGCQAEVGSACAMAAAALGDLFGLGFDKIEYAAEIAIEHHLGLTCDPICGLVQIPCIERNAVAAMRAINAVSLASFLSDSRKISLDKVIAVMKQTGLDISKQYKETAEGGLAKLKVGR
ncbi:MAG: L-serine ammonia-lyase, iron-sulfur-dependent, subunit alpha [Clostridia bacterium]|nr:L-serine ammonia-lyase, iron-sulfur-dependent, subunit alpha [Clostridia bacterium]